MPNTRGCFCLSKRLALDCGDKTENAVDCENYTANEKNDVKSVSESENKTDNDRKDRKEYCQNGFLLCLEGFDKSDKSLDSKENTEYEKNDLGCEPTENEDRDTDNKAYGAAYEILSDNVNNTGNDENDAGDRHCPTECLALEYYQKHADNKIEQGRDKIRIGFFVCHDKQTPFLKNYAFIITYSVNKNQYIFSKNTEIRRINMIFT